MLDLYESLYEVDDYNRSNIFEPIRQGLIYRKVLKNYGRNITFQKWQLSFAIISANGMFFFKADDVEGSKAKGYILLSDKDFQIKELPGQGRYMFELITTTNHYHFECCNFADKDEWKKAITKARSDCQQQGIKSHAGSNNSPRTNGNASSSSASGNQTQGNGLVMSAEVSINLKEAKDLVNVSSPFCKLCIGHQVFTSSKPSQSGNLHKFDSTHKFTINKLPVDLLVVMYDNGGKDVVGNIQIKIELAGERGDQKDWLDVRSIDLEDKKSRGKFMTIMKTRYDAETQKKVTFGVKLQDLMAREAHKGLIIPDIAYKCIKMLNKTNALQLQGVFRVPGNRNKMRDYELMFDTMGTEVDFKKSDDEHMIASMFKMFLRDMPEPLIPYDLFEETVNSTEKPSKEEIILSLRQVVAKLDPVSYRLLSITCCLLFKITQHVEKNLMKPTNLAIVFGPVFCAAPPSDELSKQQMVSKLPALSTAAEHMITEYHAIFGVDRSTDPIELMVAAENVLSEKTRNIAGDPASQVGFYRTASSIDNNENCLLEEGHNPSESNDKVDSVDDKNDDKNNNNNENKDDDDDDNGENDEKQQDKTIEKKNEGGDDKQKESDENNVEHQNAPALQESQQNGEATPEKEPELSPEEKTTQNGEGNSTNEVTNEPAENNTDTNE